MKSELMWRFLKRLVTAPTFPDPEQTRAAYWLNMALLILVPVVSVLLCMALISSPSDNSSSFFLISDVTTLIVAVIVWLTMRYGFFKFAALVLITTLFLFCTYITLVIFHSIRSPTVMAYFVLIPFVGLLLGRRNMNIFAGLCMLTIVTIFHFQRVGVLVPSSNSASIFNDAVVLLLTAILNTALLNASARRAEEKAEEIRQGAINLAIVNQKLQASQGQLQQAHNKLEDRVRQRTEDLRREVEERQRVVDALRTSEAKLRSLVENVPEVIVNIDLNGAITFINRAIRNRQPDSLIGVPAVQFHHKMQYQGLLAESMARVLESGETISYESEETTESGLQWKINRVGAIRREDKVAALILISTDITEQKQAEAAMYQAQKLESLGVLAGGVAHDFNNLLTAMLMQMSIALRKLPADHPVTLHIQRTIKAAERATELTRQMLNYSGRNQSETKPMDLNDLIMDNIHLFSAAIPKTVLLDSNLSNSIPLMMGDKGQIQQLLMNLILNGVDAIGQKAGAITVTTDIQEITADDGQYWQWTGIPLAAGRYVRLAVSDTGSGMDAKTLTKIFDPFFTTKFTGRGLGLASVLGIVRSHKGGMQVSSTVGKGTTFTLIFPVLNERLHLSDADQVSKPAPMEGELVLVIDDEDMVREAMADVLIETGLQVIKAENGPAGIQLFRERTKEIKLVLLDLSMPGMNGEEVFYKLRAINASVPILLVSGYSEQEVMEQFVNKGLAGFIQKPYTIDSLIQQIEPHLHGVSSLKNDLIAEHYP